MPVDIKHLKESIAEAERFLKRAKACLADIETVTKHNSSPREIWPDQRKSSAVRRSSMDLTRALAQLRKTY
jgi:hypothetical protein